METVGTQPRRTGSESSPIDCIEEKPCFQGRPPTYPHQNQTLVERLRATVTLGLPDRHILLEAADEIGRLQELLSEMRTTEAMSELQAQKMELAAENARLRKKCAEINAELVRLLTDGDGTGIVAGG